MIPTSIERTDLERELCSSIDRVCSDTIPRFQTAEHYGTVPRPLFQALAGAGVTALAIPEEQGGAGASALLISSVMETISRYDLGPAIFCSVHGMVSGLVARFGSSEQKQKHLPRLASGQMLAAFALSEPEAGSDAAALNLRSEKKPDGYVLNGSKCYITSAGFADVYLVFARTGAAGREGISAFLVDAATVGLSVGKPEKKMGCDLSPIASLYFENAKVPLDALIGNQGDGFKIALSGLAGGRINIAACANGLATVAIERAVAHLKSRRQFGSALIDFQGLQFMLADMYTKLEASRLLTRRAAELLDARAATKQIRLSSSAAKCFATDAAMAVTTDAVQLLGGAGYLEEYQVERLMRDAKMLQIVEGTNQIQRMLIARELADGG